MGNTSGSEFGAVMIRTDKQLFFAGDIVQGFYMIYFRKYIFKCDKIRLSW